MKKYVKKVAIFSAVIMALSFSASAQIYVKIRPQAPVMTRPAAPDNHHVWVGEEWASKNGKYQYTGGHWIDQRRGYTWVPGYWQKKGRSGDRWIAGHWQKTRRR